MCAPTDSTEQIFVLGAAFPYFQVQRSPPARSAAFILRGPE